MDVRTTKAYDPDIQNTELLEQIDVIDSEVHTTENADDIIPLLDDEELRKQEESGYVLENSANSAYGTIAWNFYNNRSGGEHGGLPLLTTPLKTVEDFEKQQSDIRADTVFINSLNALNTSQISNTRKQVAYLKAANRYQIEHIGAQGKKYFVPITINPDHPQESAELIEQYADRDHVIYAMSSAAHQFPIGNKHHEPIFEALEKHDLPLMMHGMAPSLKYFPGNTLQMDTYFEHRALGQVLGHVRNITSLIGQEIPERYDIDFAFIEHCFSSAAMLMGRLNREYGIRGFEAENLTGKPGDYIQEFYFGTQPMEEFPDPEYVGTMLEMLGLEDQILYCSDYPHPDSDNVGTIADHPGLTEEQKIKILRDNAEQFFDL